ncbi:Ku protein [Streptomyces mirabilis]|uniref:Ku protein n=1 Tax=Streptomyces mirabilis TaxID=68239 RepID=UPI0033BED8F8
MPASIFNGAISFGLVSVPITVLSAAEDHAARFRQIHTADHGLVRNHHWCEAEDREVTFAEIGRGCELSDGRVVPVTDEELRALPLPKARAIELIAFVPAAVVPPSGHPGRRRDRRGHGADRGQAGRPPAAGGPRADGPAGTAGGT